MSKVYLETERMILKTTTPEDAELFFELDADPDVMMYISGGEPSSLERCVQAAQRTYAQYERYQDKFGLWWATLKSSGEVLGWFLLRPDKLKPETVENPELGYRLHKKHWGKGYATEASQALVDKAFKELNCESVYAVAMKGNQASQNVMKKVGMIYIGEFVQDECFAPGMNPEAVEYKITKKEWSGE